MKHAKFTVFFNLLDNTPLTKEQGEQVAKEMKMVLIKVEELCS